MARRIAAMAALTGWVVAVPVLLVRWGGWPLDRAPGWTAFEGLPLPALVDQIVIGTLSVGLWGVWGQLAWSIGVELGAIARPGIRRGRPADPIRRFAAEIVAAVRRGPAPGPARPVPALPGAPGAPATPSAGDDQAEDSRRGPGSRPPAATPTTRAGSDGARGSDAAPVRDLVALLAQVDVLVRVLGPVDAIWPDLSRSPLSESRIVPVRQKALEALVYLALSDVGVTRQELTQALFPEGVESERLVYKAVHQVQKVVGHQPPPAAAGRHLLLPEQVATDYGLFCDLLVQSGSTGDREVTARLLDGALELVRGEPFSGVSRGYAWAAPHREEMVAQVVAVAEQLAELRLAADDPHAAEAAARRGLLAAPAASPLGRFLSTSPSET